MVPRGVRGVDPACRCHQSNIMPDSFFSVNIPQWVTCLFFVLFCFMCVLRGDILGSFYSERQGAQFYHYYINGLGETLSYNGLRQIGLISFKWGSLFGALSVDSKQRISFGGSSVVYVILLDSQGYWSFNQCNLQDRMLRLNSNPTLYWGRWI